MKSLFGKVVLRISVFFILITAVSIAASILYLNGSYNRRVQSELLNEARVLESLYDSESAASRYAAALHEISGIRTTVIDRRGVVLLDTEADAAALGNHLDRPEIQQALRSGTGVNVRHSATLNRELMYAAVYSARHDVFIRTALPLEGVSLIASGIWLPLAVMLAVSFLLCLAAALIVSRSVVAPVIQLKKDTRSIAEGRYDEVIPLNTGDEIEELSRSLGAMASDLKKSIDDIKEKNTRLQAVFRAVPGGILAVDKTGRVIMANPAASAMFSIKGDPEGRHLIEVVKYPEIEAVISEAFLRGGLVEKDVHIQKGMEGVSLKVFAVPVSSEGADYGVILLAQDITNLKKLENIRSEFAANVSHELKTPLTIISGFVDTLKDPNIGGADAARFLDIISLETERLSRLIGDLLLLSELENTAPAPEAPIDIREAVLEAAGLFEKSAKEKGVDMRIDAGEEALYVAAGKDRIKQLVINLVDNAVKYTPAGGSVTVEVSKDDSRAKISVSDTGVGIPPENIPRLFERFYRVDKSRSRALGGTGLGLAIAKHIASLFGGHITVRSAPGKGSRFDVYLPAADAAM